MEAGLGAELGQIDLPGADSVAVGAATIGADQESVGVGVSGFADPVTIVTG